MKGFLNYLIKPKHTLHLNDVKKSISHELHKAKLPYVVDEEIIDIIVKKSITEVVNQRNKDSGNEPSSYSDKIKVYGENSLIKDNSIWVNLESVKSLNDDLLFSKAELFLTLNHILEAFGVIDKQNELLAISEGEDINTLDDLKLLVYNLYKKDNLI
jgi:hypothetical protein